MNAVVFRNARIIDGKADRPSDPVNVIVEETQIREVGPHAHMAGAAEIDLKGHYLLPGLIDCHVHIVAGVANLGVNATFPDSLVMARSMRIQNGMLMRGFTTVRDVGGADLGQVRAWEEGLVQGPRLVISGKALSQTGGHCDFRGPFNPWPDHYWQRLGALGRTCDGIAEMRRFAREEIKAGAKFIKVMANGGVASPTDPIHFLGFSREELKVAVEEAANAGTYVSAHLYTDDAIRRAVECGVHSLEHCNLIGPETAAFAAQMGAVAVPTLVVYDKIAEIGLELGMGATAVAKVEAVRKAGMESLSIMRNAGLSMAYGSDLLGPMHTHQSEEFVLRSRVMPAHEVIASATSIGARLCGMEGKLGTIAPGTFADLLVLDADPLQDMSVLTGQGQHMKAIMQNGTFVKNQLTT